MGRITDRLAHAWNAFQNMDAIGRNVYSADMGAGYSSRPDRPRPMVSNERSIISSIYTRIAIDVASISLHHVRLDKDGRYLEDINSGLQNCLTVEMNVDQGGRQGRQDIAYSTIERGVIAVVPIDTTIDPKTSSSYDIGSLRVGEIVQWFPRHVTVRVYNDRTGRREDITVEKRLTPIVENPLYAVMNEPNSTLQRLVQKLGMLDVIDQQSSSGKLDLIIQLPYVIKSETRKQQALLRRQDLEDQLKGSKYGVAYADGTEKITQLNRPAENNLLKQVEYLTAMLYAQLGLTEDVMNGTADEKTMINYYNRTVEPILGAIAEAMIRTLLTKTARTQGQSIMYFRDPFRLVPMSEIADIADKLSRNEILASNEFRSALGYRPSKDPKADELINSNMPAPSEQGIPQPAPRKEISQNGS